MPGWVDSLNGPVGVVVAGGKGLIRSMMAAEDFYAEVVPVDIAINAIITIAYLRALNPYALIRSLHNYYNIITLNDGSFIFSVFALLRDCKFDF